MNIIDINNHEDIKEHLDNAINNWRKRMDEAEDTLKDIRSSEWSRMAGQYEEEILVASCYIDAYQSVRISLFGELLA